MSAATTRRYPRTMNEAFPRTTDYACAIERGDRYAHAGRAVGGVLAIVLLMLVASWIWRSARAEPIETATLADARTQAQHQARMDKAAAAMCAGNVAWVDAERGVVQCGAAKKRVAP